MTAVFSAWTWLALSRLRVRRAGIKVGSFGTTDSSKRKRDVALTGVNVLDSCGPCPARESQYN